MQRVRQSLNIGGGAKRSFSKKVFQKPAEVQESSGSGSGSGGGGGDKGSGESNKTPNRIVLKKSKVVFKDRQS